MRDSLGPVLKILGISLVGALLIRYVAPLAPLPREDGVALAIVLLPPSLMALWLWRQQ